MQATILYIHQFSEDNYRYSLNYASLLLFLLKSLAKMGKANKNDCHNSVTKEMTIH